MVVVVVDVVLVEWKHGSGSSQGGGVMGGPPSRRAWRRRLGAWV